MAETLETDLTTDLALDDDVPLDLEFDSDFSTEFEWSSVDFLATTLALGEEDCDPWEDVFIIAQAPSDPEMPVVPDPA